MNDTVQITAKVKDDARDELIAVLAQTGYDAFEETENELSAFIEENVFDAQKLEQVLAKYNVPYTKSIIKNQNWNALWESNFDPVIVDDFCVVRAAFHSSFTGIRHEIIITPKMSFGTGHHATTYMMMSEMRHIDFINKAVADFGTGTGVLAILAEKLGSKNVWAIDNDEWSINNSKENIEKNNCIHINIEQKDGFNTSENYDVILANINRNIILDNANKLASAITRKGSLLVSGLLKEDEIDVMNAFLQNGLKHIHTSEKNKWIFMLLCKN